MGYHKLLHSQGVPRYVRCPSCNVFVSVDRAACPHCGLVYEVSLLERAGKLARSALKRRVERLSRRGSIFVPRSR